MALDFFSAYIGKLFSKFKGKIAKKEVKYIIKLIKSHDYAHIWQKCIDLSDWMLSVRKMCKVIMEISAENNRVIKL